MKTEFDRNELITKDNVKRMGEYISIACARGFCTRYYSDKAKKLYDGLVRDVYHHNGDPARNYTDGYDLAMEAICFLCQHMGRRLSDMTKVLKYGVLKPVTIFDGCFFIVSQYINNRACYVKRIQSIDDPVFLETFDENYTMENSYIYSEEDWEKVDSIIESMNLTEKELKVLECRIAGLSYPQMARELHCGQSTAYDKVRKIRDKYTSIYFC